MIPHKFDIKVGPAGCRESKFWPLAHRLRFENDLNVGFHIKPLDGLWSVVSQAPDGRRLLPQTGRVDNYRQKRLSKFLDRLTYVRLRQNVGKTRKMGSTL